jgi:hypothetical protein
VTGSKGTALLKFIAVLTLVSIGCGSSDVCNCTPSVSASRDYRHQEKHVPLPALNAQEIDVNTILSWKQDPNLPTTQPRTGRELQLFHIATAYLQSARLMKNDCDIHLEISESASKNAPRVIVETPVDAEYCPARRTIQSELAQHNFKLSTSPASELPAPLKIDVLGTAFEDFEHQRGSAQVGTVWELHPAVVRVTE